MYEYIHEPWRSVFLFYNRWATRLLFKPFWYLVSLPPALRPVSTWSLDRAVRVREVTRDCWVEDRVGVPETPDHTQHVPWAGDAGVFLDPLPDGLVLGTVRDAASTANVTPTTIVAYWARAPSVAADSLPHDAPAAPGERVLLSLHGGGYTALSAAPGWPNSGMVKALLGACTGVKRALAPEYRLASTSPLPERNPYPAQLLDALAAYKYLINGPGFEPGNIIVEGDSAGGNLGLALVRYLLEHAGVLSHHAQAHGTKALGVPGALLLISPAPDIGTSHRAPAPGYFSLTDFIWTTDHPDASWADAAYCGPHGFPAAADTDPYISCVSKHIAPRPSFGGFPRTFICAGGAERMVGAIRTLKERMSTDMGEGAGPGRVEYVEAQGALHDYLMFGFWEPERSETLRRIGEWIDAV